MVVPATGLEPVRCYSLEPESSASANSATRATALNKAPGTTFASGYWRSHRGVAQGRSFSRQLMNCAVQGAVDGAAVFSGEAEFEFVAMGWGEGGDLEGDGAMVG